MDRFNPPKRTPAPRPSRREKHPTGQDLAEAFEILKDESPHKTIIGGPNNSEIVDIEGNPIISFDGTAYGLKSSLNRYILMKVLQE